MNKIRTMILVLLYFTFLTACGRANASQPTTTSTLLPELQFTETTVATSEEPAKFPLTYQDGNANIQFAYPQDWTVSPDQVIGERGAQAALLSPGSSLEALTDGGTRIILTTYLWDPKNDLTAYIAQRKIAWEASGFTVLGEESIDLEDNRSLLIFTVVTAEKETVLFAFTNSGENYLQIFGDGDLQLCREIMNTIEPIG